MLDTLRTVETPEGIGLDVRVAGPVSRAAAFLLDFSIRMGIYSFSGMFFVFLGEAGFGFFLIFLFLVEWFYPVLFELLFEGATPGKMALGLQVLHQDGTPVGWSASLVRNLTRFADFMPFAYGFGLVSMLVDDQFRRLGDLTAGTVVVYRDRPRAPGALAEARPEAPPVRLSLEEQGALLAFAERSARFSPARAVELAGVLREVSGAEGAEGVRRLHAWARWLVGTR